MLSVIKLSRLGYIVNHEDVKFVYVLVNYELVLPRKCQKSRNNTYLLREHDTCTVIWKSRPAI